MAQTFKNNLPIDFEMTHFKPTLLIFFLLSFLANGQQDSLSKDTIVVISSCNCYSLDYYLLTRKTIVEGTVQKINRKNFRIKEIDRIKGKSVKLPNKNRLIVLQLTDGKGNDGAADLYSLSEKEKYIFILGKTRWRFSKTILRSPYNRFQIVKDSVFIPYDLLKQLNLSEDFIHEKIKYSSQNKGYGYDMSVAEFKLLVKTLNEIFQRNEKGYFYKKEINIILKDPLTLALITHAETTLIVTSPAVKNP